MSRDDYLEGRSRSAAALMATRRAEHHARFFLPHLAAGLRVLDCGCGAGTITVGLAAAVAPGPVVGIDTVAAFDAGRRLAAEAVVDNVSFQVASACELPFGDSSFDAVFVHAVLSNLPTPEAALREIHRVLAPGGRVGIREFDYGLSFVMPTDAPLQLGHELRSRLRRAAGHDPETGRRVPALLAAAGFTCLEAAPTFEYADDPESLASFGNGFADIFAEAYAQPAIERGFVDRAGADAVVSAWRALAARPGALAAQAWIEAVGLKGQKPKAASSSEWRPRAGYET